MDESPLEETLFGGNAGVDVVRVGNTVRRPAQPWSKSVDALLTYLEKSGFEGAPRALGYDEQGRQMLSFVEGYVDPDPFDLTTARLFDVGALIRQLHDATAGFPVPRDAEWNVLIVPDRTALIGHHDLAPWNLVRTETCLTFIDWDGAGPGSRLWDLAYAVHGFVPLSSRSGLSDEAAGERLRALVDGYQLESAERRDLVAILGPRIRSMYEFLKTSYEQDVEPWRRLWLEGHGQLWFEDAEYTEQRIATWERVVL